MQPREPSRDVMRTVAVIQRIPLRLRLNVAHSGDCVGNEGEPVCLQRREGSWIDFWQGNRKREREEVTL